MPGGTGRKTEKNAEISFAQTRKTVRSSLIQPNSIPASSERVNAGRQCLCFNQTANPDKQRPASAERQMPADNAPVLTKRQTPVQRTGVCLLTLPFFYSCRCGICASLTKAATKSSSLTVSCFSEPRRRTVTVPFSFSLAPTTAITGTLANECSRTL